MKIICVVMQTIKLVCWCLFGLLSLSLEARAKEREFGDWVLHCDDNNKVCSISQVAKVEESGETLMQINLVFDHSSATAVRKVVFVLPLGTALNTPPTLFIANGPIAALNIDYCLEQGCYFSLPISDALLGRFLGMFSGYVEVHSTFGDSLNIPISGEGTRAAFNSYQERF